LGYGQGLSRLLGVTRNVVVAASSFLHYMHKRLDFVYFRNNDILASKLVEQIVLGNVS